MKTAKGAFTLKTKYFNHYCYLEVERYRNNNLCLIAHDDVTDDVIMRLTTNPTFKLTNDEICIMTHYENTGLQECLIEQGLIEPTPVRSFESHFVAYPVHRLTEKGKALIANATERRTREEEAA